MRETYEDFEQILDADPSWAAFLYVSDELTDGDAVRFEDELGVRADLQDALIVATRSVATISTPATKSASLVRATEAPSARRWSSFASVVAACLGLMIAAVAVVSWSGSGDAIDGVVEQTNLDESIESEIQVLTAWIDIREEQVSEPVEESDSDSDLDVPDWMLTAVLLDDDFSTDVDSNDESKGSVQSESI